MEYIDAGSVDKLEAGGIPEDVLGRITGAMVRGLKFLKDDMQIIHRGTCPSPFPTFLCIPGTGACCLP